MNNVTAVARDYSKWYEYFSFLFCAHFLDVDKNAGKN